MLARLVAAAIAISVGPAARADVEPLRWDLKLDLALTAAASAVALGLSSPLLAPSGCRMCGTDAFDARAREALAWRSPALARSASDVLASGVIPLGAVLNSVLSARSSGQPSAAAVDLLVVAEAAALAAVPNLVAKDAVARRRPEGGNGSFYSGHTSLAFSVAAAAGTVSTMRGYPSAPWVWAGGMALATGVGYLRVAGDAHWTTDVAAGAVAGGLVGFAVPWFLHRPLRARRRWAVLPAPGGLTILF